MADLYTNDKVCQYWKSWFEAHFSSAEIPVDIRATMCNKLASLQVISINNLAKKIKMTKKDSEREGHPDYLLNVIGIIDKDNRILIEAAVTHSPEFCPINNPNPTDGWAAWKKEQDED